MHIVQAYGMGDLGLAKVCKSAKTRCGTPDHMAREVICGQDYDDKADIYGMGVVLFHVYPGDAPFRAPIDGKKLIGCVCN